MFGSTLGASIHIPWSKGDPTGSGADISFEPGATTACPVLLLDAYMRRQWGTPLSSWSSSSNQPFFLNHRAKALSSQIVKDMVRSVASHAGLQGRFGSHSLRISGACLAILGGLSLEQTMAIGCWRSRAIEQYLRAIVAAASHASFHMGL
jgi:hypothetical protein